MLSKCCTSLKCKKPKYIRKLAILGIMVIILFIHIFWRCPLDPKEDIECHSKITFDDLPPFEETIKEKPRTLKNRMYFPNTLWGNERNMFFHETSCRGDLTPREACAIESTVRAHPNWTIYVLFSGPVSKNNTHDSDSVIFHVKKYYSNVKFRRIYIKSYVKNTPMEHLVANGELSRSKYRCSHTSDVLRFTTLYKYPGVYLDLDIIVSRPIDQLERNFVIRESDTAVSSGVLAFSGDGVGRSFASAVAEEIRVTFDGSDFGHNGPGVVTRVMQRFCTTSRVDHMNKDLCKGMTVYPPAIAYPIPWLQAVVYFQRGRISPHQMSHAYMYHVWGKFSRCFIPDEDSPYHQLAKEFCPKVYAEFKAKFGFRNVTKVV